VSEYPDSRPRARGDATRRWLRLWLVGVILGLLLTAVFVAGRISRPLPFLLALVLVSMTPFAHARLRLFDFLDELAGHRAIARRALPAAAAVSAALDAGMIAQLITGRSGWQLPLFEGEVLGWVGPVWFSAHAMLFLGLALGRPLRALLRLLRRIFARGRGPALAVDDELASPQRRQFLQGATAMGMGFPFVVSLSGVETSYDFRVEERDIELARWPSALDGLRVAHLSDIHVGGAMNRDRLLRIAELTNAARPDLVLHTGDFLTHREGDFDAPLYEALARIRAPRGQWACLGNHDYDNVGRIVAKLRGAGVEVLRNRLVAFDAGGSTLEIAGLDFLFYGFERESRYRQIFSTWPALRHPRLLLNHDPTAFQSLPEGCADLVLSGHTHGGHVGVQLTSATALTVVGLSGLPDQGIFDRGTMRMYVTRCVGFYGYPIRIGIPPEIAILTLRAPRRTAA
jgi:predicted MPP superfamily phosphohydrolase